MKMSVDQYQQVYLLSTGLTSSQYTQAVIKIFKIDGEKYKIKEIREKVDSISIPEPKEIRKFKLSIDGTKFTIVNDLMKSSFNEWIQYESIVGVSPNEEDIIRNIHKILGIFVRPTKRKLFFWKKITPLADTDIEANQEVMKKMNIEDALNINVFFYLRELSFMTDIKKFYLNQRSRLAQVKVDMKNKQK